MWPRESSGCRAPSEGGGCALACGPTQDAQKGVCPVGQGRSWRHSFLPLPQHTHAASLPRSRTRQDRTHPSTHPRRQATGRRSAATLLHRCTTAQRRARAADTKRSDMRPETKRQQEDERGAGQDSPWVEPLLHLVVHEAVQSPHSPAPVLLDTDPHSVPAHLHQTAQPAGVGCWVRALETIREVPP
eukprot:3937511-Rhodomonas_salina.1